MGRKNIGEQLEHQIRMQFHSGHSKRQARIEQKARNPDGIYSFATRDAYIRWCLVFAKWIHRNHPKSYYKHPEQVRDLVPIWLQEQINSGKSAWTIHLQSCALAKAYHCTSSDWGIDLPARERKNIRRSRVATQQDRHVSQVQHADLIRFLQHTGLRRHEAAALLPEDLCCSNGQWTIIVRQGKGGKRRIVPVIPGIETQLAAYAAQTPGKPVFKKLPAQLDIHGLRREYAQAWYDRLARPLEQLPRQELYICRKDKAGIRYDRAAMLTVSRYLGHNRIDVIGAHYLS